MRRPSTEPGGCAYVAAAAAVREGTEEDLVGGTEGNASGKCEVTMKERRDEGEKEDESCSMVAYCKFCSHRNDKIGINKSDQYCKIPHQYRYYRNYNSHDHEDSLYNYCHRHNRWKYINDNKQPTIVTVITRCCRLPPYIATLLIISYTLLGVAGKLTINLLLPVSEIHIITFQMHARRDRHQNLGRQRQHLDSILHSTHTRAHRIMRNGTA